MSLFNRLYSVILVPPGSLSPSIHKFDDELIPSGLSAEGASGVEFTDLNTSPKLRIEALRPSSG